MRQHEWPLLPHNRLWCSPIAKRNQHYSESVSRLLSVPRQHFVDLTFTKSEKISSPLLEPVLLTYKHQHLHH